MDAALPLAEQRVAPEPVEIAALYDATVDLAWRMLARLGVPANELEDAVQDVYVVAHRRLSTLRGDAKASTWVGGIAVRVAHDYRRRAARKPSEPLEMHSATLEDLRARPDDAVARAQAAQLLERVLDAMDPVQREAFVLAELEQWSAPQIAAATGAQVNTVYSRIRLARAKFNELSAALERGGA